MHCLGQGLDRVLKGSRPHHDRIATNIKVNVRAVTVPVVHAIRSCDPWPTWQHQIHPPGVWLLWLMAIEH